jgi:uncharacterized protein (DUF779 family)
MPPKTENFLRKMAFLINFDRKMRLYLVSPKPNPVFATGGYCTPTRQWCIARGSDWSLDLPQKIQEINNGPFFFSEENFQLWEHQWIGKVPRRESKYKKISTHKGPSYVF